MFFDKSLTIKIIEGNFRNIKMINKAYNEALQDYKFDHRSGGCGGNALISDPTASCGVHMAEPPYVPAVTIIAEESSKTRKYSKLRTIYKPRKWLELYGFVQKYAGQNDLRLLVFNSRYIKGELHTKFTAEHNISTTAYYNVRDDIMSTALAAACQLGIVKVL